MVEIQDKLDYAHAIAGWLLELGDGYIHRGNFERCAEVQFHRGCHSCVAEGIAQWVGSDIPAVRVLVRLGARLDSSTSDSSIYVEQREPSAWPRMAHEDSADPACKKVRPR